MGATLGTVGTHGNITIRICCKLDFDVHLRILIQYSIGGVELGHNREIIRFFLIVFY